MYFEEFHLGDTVEIRPVTIEKEEMLAFARKYDSLPMHTDEEYAKRTGFGALIAPGIMSFMSVWASFLQENTFGNEVVAGTMTKVEWYKPVFAGDMLSGKAVVTALAERGVRNGVVELTLYAYNQKGDLVLTDVTEVIIKRKKS